MQKQILLSGVQPTGKPHIGNYFGAMKQFVELQNKGYDCLFMIADYHGLNFIKNGNEMRENTIELAIDYLAIGLDPKKSIIFKQSDVPAHTELCWIFDTLTTMPYLMRAHAFKDAEAKDKEISVGTFNYPMLMAADILLYDTDVVPVGQDQKQHVEYSRDTAQKFNNTFGETFKLPKDLIIESVKTVPGTDGRKMSKSYGNTIGLFATDEEIKKAVMGIPTDSKGVADAKDPATDKIFALHELVSSHMIEDLRNRYVRGGLGYKESKEILIANLISFIKPLRERRASIASNRKKVLKMLVKGGKAANKRAEKTLDAVKTKIGVK